MLAVNGQVLNLNDTKESNPLLPYVNRVLDAYKNMEKRYKFPIRLKYLEKFKIENPKDPGKKPRYKGGAVISFKENVATPLGGEIWEYFETSVPDSNGKMVFSPSNFIFTGILDIPVTKKDLAYFLLYCSRFCENSLSPEINKLQTDKYFLIENKREEAIDFIQSQYKESRSKILILQDCPEETLRAFAVNYGVTNAMTEELTIEEVRSSLWGCITRRAVTNRRIYDEVCEKLVPKKDEVIGNGVEYSDSDKRGLLQNLLDSGIIKAVRHGKIFQYEYITPAEDGKKVFARAIGSMESEQEFFESVIVRFDKQVGLFEIAKKLETAIV
jgi:predicted transcriptional regulator